MISVLLCFVSADRVLQKWEFDRVNNIPTWRVSGTPLTVGAGDERVVKQCLTLLDNPGYAKVLSGDSYTAPGVEGEKVYTYVDNGGIKGWFVGTWRDVQQKWAATVEYYTKLLRKAEAEVTLPTQTKPHHTGFSQLTTTLDQTGAKEHQHLKHVVNLGLPSPQPASADLPQPVTRPAPSAPVVEPAPTQQPQILTVLAQRGDISASDIRTFGENAELKDAQGPLTLNIGKIEQINNVPEEIRKLITNHPKIAAIEYDQQDARQLAPIQECLKFVETFFPSNKPDFEEMRRNFRSQMFKTDWDLSWFPIDQYDLSEFLKVSLYKNYGYGSTPSGKFKPHSINFGRLQLTDDHIERIRWYVSSDQHIQYFHGGYTKRNWPEILPTDVGARVITSILQWQFSDKKEKNIKVHAYDAVKRDYVPLMSLNEFIKYEISRIIPHTSESDKKEIIADLQAFYEVLTSHKGYGNDNEKAAKQYYEDNKNRKLTIYPDGRSGYAVIRQLKERLLEAKYTDGIHLTKWPEERIQRKIYYS